jgi:hypothetical protein
MNEAAHSGSTLKRWFRKAAFLVASGVALEAVLIRQGQTYGSTPEERELRLLGDEIVPNPQVVTNHAITIDSPAERVWPWLVQMGWHRAGWYTARWVDKLLFPLNWPSANLIIPELQDIHVGDFIPDGAPGDQVWISRRRAGTRSCNGASFHKPSAAELAGQGLARLVMGVRSHSS